MELTSREIMQLSILLERFEEQTGISKSIGDPGSIEYSFYRVNMAINERLVSTVRREHI